jgi:hypothetical protein
LNDLARLNDRGIDRAVNEIYEAAFELIAVAAAEVAA